MKNIESRIPLLDLLRSLAIALVLAVHFGESLMPGGSVGVSVFFCLSGFLITQTLQDRKIGNREFLVRRFFRIYPAYLFVVAMYVTIFYISDQQKFNEILQKLPLIILTTDVSWVALGLGVLWTLQIEAFFYLLAPLIFRLIPVTLQVAALFILIAVSFLLKTGELKGWLSNSFIQNAAGFSFVKMFFWADNLLYGSLAAFVTRALNRRNYSINNKIGFALPILLFTIIIIIAKAWPSNNIYWPFQSSLVSALTAVIIVLGLENTLLNNCIPRLFSTISLLTYALYLTHSFLIDFYFIIHDRVAIQKFAIRFPLQVFFTCIIAAAVFAFVERPGVALGKRLLGKRKGQ
ncbi:acyltransferase family protein [Leeia aquatica]|uniref:Acyltransferase n=1 Tax=Leeia aquatica TaxID=2725557 RepID=A0A847S684_9NEIS|nr:acyltransferase [Leeia aquatica]NLR74577.1 acyltransferase [Leeia aquatica]